MRTDTCLCDGATASIDTHKAIKALQAGGLTAGQAEAIVVEFSEALDNCLHEHRIVRRFVQGN